MVVVSPTRRRQARLLGAHYLARINSSIAIVVAPRLTKHSLHCSDLPVLTVRSSTIGPFTNEETGTWRGNTCPGSHSLEVLEPGFDVRLFRSTKIVSLEGNLKNLHICTTNGP